MFKIDMTVCAVGYWLFAIGFWFLALYDVGHMVMDCFFAAETMV